MVMVERRDIRGNMREGVMRMRVRDKGGFEGEEVDIEVKDGEGEVGVGVGGGVVRVYMGWKGFGVVWKGKFRVDEVEEGGGGDVVRMGGGSGDFGGRVNWGGEG